MHRFVNNRGVSPPHDAPGVLLLDAAHGCAFVVRLVHRLGRQSSGVGGASPPVTLLTKQSNSTVAAFRTTALTHQPGGSPGSGRSGANRPTRRGRSCFQRIHK